MKMSHKLIIIFSLLAVLTTAANSVCFYHSSIENLNESTNASLNALGNKMLIEIEEYMQLMDYALEELTSSVDFMNAFHAVYLHESTEDIGELVSAQNVMSRVMCQAPLQAAFYRVSAYTKNGFYLTNLFEKTNAVVSFSDEAREAVGALAYLKQVDENPFQRYIVCPRSDPWSSRQAVTVFSAVKAVIWHGQFIGYLEVSASLEDLINIFSLKDNNIQAQAIFDNGDRLYRHPDDAVVYHNIDSRGMTRYRLDDGGERLVIMLRSKSLGLNIYVAQDMSVYNRSVRSMLLRYATVAGIVLVFTILFVVLFSLGLTRAIRQLNKKIRHLPAENLMAHPEETIATLVTSPADQEIYQLECSFNGLISRLQISHKNEVALREGALKAHLNALQMQINPHFVYNTLNIISAKGMESGSEEITELCDQFAQMLRYATDLRSQTATLQEELDNVERYLMLSKARYEDQLQFTIDVPSELTSLSVPKLTLQPLVENALTHGFKGSACQRQIFLKGCVSENTLLLSIRDNGIGFGQDVLHRMQEALRKIERANRPQTVAADQHLGLINTYLRLHYYSKGNIRMRLYNEGGAVVALMLPISEEEKHV